MNARTDLFRIEGKLAIYSSSSEDRDIRLDGEEVIHLYVPFFPTKFRINASRSFEDAEEITKMVGTRDVLAVSSRALAAIGWPRCSTILCLLLSEKYVANALGPVAPTFGATLMFRDPFIRATAEQLTQILAHGTPSAVVVDAMATSIAYRVGMELAREAGAPHSGDSAVPLSDQDFAAIRQYLGTRLDTAISVAELGNHLGMSEWHFARRFKATTGVPPIAFILERRYERAKSLLSGSKLSITEIALEIGLTHSHFSRSFISRFGLSPREFRRNSSSIDTGIAAIQTQDESRDSPAQSA